MPSMNDITIRAEMWTPDGSVLVQSRYAYDENGVRTGVEVASKPPWLWKSVPQTAPTMPAWMKDDAQWQAALDAQD